MTITVSGKIRKLRLLNCKIDRPRGVMPEYMITLRACPQATAKAVLGRFKQAVAAEAAADLDLYLRKANRRAGAVLIHERARLKWPKFFDYVTSCHLGHASPPPPFRIYS